MMQAGGVSGKKIKTHAQDDEKRRVFSKKFLEGVRRRWPHNLPSLDLYKMCWSNPEGSSKSLPMGLITSQLRSMVKPSVPTS